MTPPQNAHAPERAHRPARYLIEGDRFLRAAVGPGASEYAMPPLLRPLSDEQVAGVWAALRDSGLAAPEQQGGGGGPVEVSTAPTLEELGDRSLVVISYKLNKTRRTLVLDPAQSPEQAAKAFELVDQLAELAWIRRNHP